MGTIRNGFTYRRALGAEVEVAGQGVEVEEVEARVGPAAVQETAHGLPGRGARRIANRAPPSSGIDTSRSPEPP
jgi:hypothetical protein